MSKKPILVAGGGGFIGGHLVERLLNDGYKVRSVDVKPMDE
jgi:GDP-D-mannose 3', 5'-epimerase